MALAFIGRRLLAAIPVVLGVTVITFGLMHATAGSYVPGLDLNPLLKPKDIENLRHLLGLDLPLYVQYLNWIGVSQILAAVGLGSFLGGAGNAVPGILQGDFGHSMVDNTAVTSQLFERLPNTLELTVTAILLGIAVSIPIGVAAALRRGSRVDHALTVVATAGLAVPAFWLGLVLILVFSVTFEAHGLPWLPSSGAITPFEGGDVLDRLQHLVMPAVVLSFIYIAAWSRYLRSSMIESLSQDYVRTARAKGLSERRVVYWHALRNAVIPLVTLVGLELPTLVSGGLVVEVVFGWPGVGLLLYQRALAYDYPMVLGITMFATVLVVLGNLLADVLYAVFDPRVRLG